MDMMRGECIKEKSVFQCYHSTVIYYFLMAHSKNNSIGSVTC